MTDGFQRFRSAVPFQATAVIAADSLSAGTQADFDTKDGSGTGNVEGAFALHIEIDVTAWTADTSCSIYQQALQHDGLGYCEEELLGIKGGITGTGKYTLTVYDMAEKGRLILKAGSVGITASGSMRAVYPSDA